MVRSFLTYYREERAPCGSNHRWRVKSRGRMGLKVLDMVDDRSRGDRVVLTGLTQDELRSVRGRDRAAGAQCYLCKRPDGARTLALRIPAERGPRIEEVEGNLYRIAAAAERPDFVDATLSIRWVPVHRDDGTEFLVPLCQECSMLLDRWPERRG